MAQPPAASPPPDKPASWRGYLLVAIGTAILTGLVALWLNRPKPQPIALHPPPTSVPTPSPAPTPTSAPVVVFVSGAVQTPGLYSLPPDARVGDALKAAGGFSDAANVDAVNQAEHVWDGAQVHVPALSEPSVMEPPAGVSGVTRGTSGIDLSGELSVTGLVDINRATLEELDTLPGIGPAKAQAIIDGRPYDSIDDLDRVPGIGPAIIAQLRDLVTVP